MTPKQFYDASKNETDDLPERFHHETSQPAVDSVGGNMGDIMFGMQDEYYKLIIDYKKLKKDMESMYFYPEIIKPLYPFSTLNILKGVH